MQQARFDIGKEAVHNFSLPPEDRLVLELAEWVTRTARRVPVGFTNQFTYSFTQDIFSCILYFISLGVMEDDKFQ